MSGRLGELNASLNWRDSLIDISVFCINMRTWVQIHSSHVKIPGMVAFAANSMAMEMDKKVPGSHWSVSLAKHADSRLRERSRLKTEGGSQAA